jgi:hypothetical protein
MLHYYTIPSDVLGHEPACSQGWQIIREQRELPNEIVINK